MVNATNLIRRAKEFAKLRKGAAPGPYRCHAFADLFEINDKHGSKIHNGRRNRKLIEASYEMAELLEKTADALERARRIAIEDAIIEISCEACDGTGVWKGYTRDDIVAFCEECGGSGLTERPFKALEMLLEDKEEVK